MGLWELCHLLFEQGSQIGSPQMESSWQIILFGPHSVWKIGTFHIKIHLSSLLKKIRYLAILNGNFSAWQKLARSELWLFSLHGGTIHFHPPYSLLPCSQPPTELAGPLAPGFRGAVLCCLNHLSLSPHCTLSGRSFLCFMFGVCGCVLFFFPSSLKVDFLLYFLLFELLGVTFSVYYFYYFVYLKEGDYSGYVFSSHHKNAMSSLPGITYF